MQALLLTDISALRLGKEYVSLRPTISALS